MANKFQNKYRIPSARLQRWHYANEGGYFITICTRDRFHYFGEIEKDKIILSNIGVIADLIWHEITQHAKDIELGEFVVMPNLIHRILFLNNNISINDVSIDNKFIDNVSIDNVETRHALSLQSE